MPIAVRISALCGQARQLELKSDQETTPQGTRKRKADSDRRQNAFLGALEVWLQSPYCLVCHRGACGDLEPRLRGPVRRGEFERGSEVRRLRAGSERRMNSGAESARSGEQCSVLRRLLLRAASGLHRSLAVTRIARTTTIMLAAHVARQTHDCTAIPAIGRRFGSANHPSEALV